MNWKTTVEAFVRNPAELAGGSNHTGTPSVSVRSENGGWALYSYETCIARRWNYPTVVDEERPRPGMAFLFWVTSYRYTVTTNKYIHQLTVELSRLSEARVFRFHVDPCDFMSAESYLLKVAEGERTAEEGYAPGFGPSRGKNKVQTTFGQLHRPRASRKVTNLVNRKGEF